MTQPTDEDRLKMGPRERALHDLMDPENQAKMDMQERRDLFRAGQRLHRMLGPWTEDPVTGWNRSTVAGLDMGTVHRAGKGFQVILNLWGTGFRGYPDLEEAKAAADKALTEAGWELVD